MSNKPGDEKRQPTTQEVARSEPIEDRKKSDAGESEIQDDIKHDYSQDSKEANSQIEPSRQDDDPEKAIGSPIERTTSSLPMSKARSIALVITLTGAAFLNTMSNQAVVIILPTIGRDLDIPAARQQWIVSAYSLTFGCFLLLWGRIADVCGKRKVFIWGSAWVCLTTLVCPFIPSEIGFDVFRGLQGLGAAANVPTAIGILGVTFPPGKAKNYAFATYSSGAPLGSVIGNILGGVVGQYASWRWVLWILAILAAMVTVAGHFVIPVPKPRTEPMDLKNSVDWAGGATITISILVLLFALTEGNVVGWATPWIPVLIILSFLLLAAFSALFYTLDSHLEKFYIFSPESLHELSLRAIGAHGNDTAGIVQYIVGELSEKLPGGYVNLDEEWIFNNAGGAMGAMYIIHASEFFSLFFSLSKMVLLRC